jgi:hypothetical protein
VIRRIVVFAVVATLSSSIHARGAEAQAVEPRALTVFADALALARRAVTSHWLVGQPEWTAAAASWKRLAGKLAPDVRGLRRCWAPVAEARGSIEQAHRLFERARQLGDDAYALFDEHKRLLGVADRRLGVAERCYRTAAHRTR